MPFDDQVQLALAASMVAGLFVLALRHVALRRRPLVERAGEWLYWLAGSTALTLAAEML